MNCPKYARSYVNLLDYRSHRREHLRKHYYFGCACERCSDEDGERAMFCVSCAECGGDSVYLGGGGGIEEEIEDEEERGGEGNADVFVYRDTLENHPKVSL